MSVNSCYIISQSEDLLTPKTLGFCLVNSSQETPRNFRPRFTRGPSSGYVPRQVRAGFLLYTPLQEAQLCHLRVDATWLASARVHCWAGSAVIPTAGVACEAEPTHFSERPRLWGSRLHPCPANYLDSIKVDRRSLRGWEHIKNEMQAQPHRYFSYMDKRQKLAATLINFPKNGG